MITVGNVNLKCVHTFGTDRHKRRADITLLFEYIYSRLGMSVTTQGGSGRQCVTGSGRNIPKYRFVLLNVYRFWET